MRGGEEEAAAWWACSKRGNGGAVRWQPRVEPGPCLHVSDADLPRHSRLKTGVSTRRA